MELSNKDIWAARIALNQLASQKFAVMTSYKLAKAGHILRGQLEVIDETRNKLIEKHGQPGPNGKPTLLQQIDSETEKDKTGNPVKVYNPEWEKFNAEFAELLAQKVELKIEKVKLPEMVASTCDKCHHNMDRPLEIEPEILMALDMMIEI